MKILIVQPKVPIYGGAEHVIVQFANYLNKQRGITCDILMPNLPISMERDLVMNNGKAMKAGLKLLPRIADQYDCIQAHNFPAPFVAMVASKTAVVWYCHEPPELFSNLLRWPVEALNRSMVKRHRCNVVVSDEFNRERFWRLYDFNPQVINYGIDYRFWQELPHHGGGNRFVVSQVGVIQPFKRQLETLMAAKAVKEFIPEIEVRLIGHIADAGYQKVLNDYIYDNNMGYVKFIPHANREQVRAYYQSTDVVMQPCGPQGGWLTPFEAISAGVPVIASPDMTCSKILEDNRLCYVTRDYTSTLKIVYRIYHQLKPTAAQRWIMRNLSWSVFGQKMLSVIEKEVGKCTRRRRL